LGLFNLGIIEGERDILMLQKMRLKLDTGTIKGGSGKVIKRGDKLMTVPKSDLWG